MNDTNKDERGEEAVDESQLVRVGCLTFRVLFLAIASVFLLPVIGFWGLWDEWKSEIEMIRNGY